MMKIFYSFTEAYRELLKDVYETPDFISAPRGQKIREKLGVTFKIVDPLQRLPYIKARDFSASYFVAESLWYLSGNDSTEWISKYSSFWKNISDDGTTANSAYGARIFKPHDRISKDVDISWTQWNYVLDELTKDNDSRRAVIHIRSPKDSILASKDVPCTLSLQFFLRDEKVHMVVSMRSSDLILGIAYDVPAFTTFQELLSIELSKKLSREIGVGDYIHTSNSLHIYERHFKLVENILSEEPVPTPRMPQMPRVIPIEEMMKFESVCSSLTTSEEVLASISQISLDEYWCDWCKILAAHRLTKLGALEESTRLLNTTKFEGYRFFSK